MNKSFLAIISLLFFCSCNYLTQDASIIPIARVNDSYLYNEDIIDLISKNTTKDDSTLIVNNFINRWATKQLLIDQSMINSANKVLANDNPPGELLTKLPTKFRSEVQAKAVQLGRTLFVRAEVDELIKRKRIATIHIVR